MLSFHFKEERFSKNVLGTNDSFLNVLAPCTLTSRDESVKYYLGSIKEVSKLSFPNWQ